MSKVRRKAFRGKGNSRGVRLFVEGRATIENMGEISEAFQTGLSGADVLEIDLNGVQATDITFLQLLCAACRAAVSDKKNVILVGELPDNFDDEVRGSGFLRMKGCIPETENECFWLKG